MAVAMHMCRSNMNAFWGGDGSYEPMAEVNVVNIDVFLLEYDTPRAGDFTPLRHVPRTSRSCSASSRPRTRISRRRTRSSAASTRRRAKSMSPSLPIFPQCGFSTNLFGTDFTVDIERRKLALLVKTAAEVWGA
jgi:5-methyltetrahydropteroyltriglutamate--homocysteine methyltransferase